jgi:RNA polymerase sigma-70 factor (ECF subfamily)
MTGKGDNPMLAAFVLHYDELVAFVRRKVGSGAAATDIVQETGLRIAGGGAGPAAAIRNPRAYLYRAAANLATDRLRAERRQAERIVPGPPCKTLPSPEPDAERAMLDRERLDRLTLAVGALPPRCREVFVLRRFEGLAHEAIAARLGISRNMVEKHLRNAILHCSRALDED